MGTVGMLRGWWEEPPPMWLSSATCSSFCLLAPSARPRIWRLSAVWMKEGSMCWGTLASPLYMYSTRDLRLSKSTSFMMMTGCLSLRKEDLNRV